MSIVRNHEIEYVRHKIGKTEILHLALAARKFAWRRFPAYCELSNPASNLDFKEFSSLLFRI